MSKKLYARLLALLYALALAALCAVKLAGWAVLADCESLSLLPADAAWEALRNDRSWDEAGWPVGSLLTTDGDARLEWTVDGPVSGLAMRIESSQPVREPVLYYTTEPGQQVTAARQLTPVRYDAAAGSWLFLMPMPQRVHTLRLDPTASAGAFIRLEVTLNPQEAAAAWWLPTPAWLLGLALLPPLAAVCAAQAWDVMTDAKHRPKERRS